MRREEFESTVRELFGESVTKMSEFRDEQIDRLEKKIQEIAHEGMKDELNRMSSEILDLRRRIQSLEHERAEELSAQGEY